MPESTHPFPDCPGCRQYRPGHRLHHIQLRLLGQRPDRWRRLVVVDRSPQELVLFDEDEGRVVMWHHAPFPDDLVPGSVVHHHEGLDVLVRPDGVAHCVDFIAGDFLAEPEEIHGRVIGIVDLSTGNGLVEVMRS